LVLKIGFIGLGRMGQAMASRLLAADQKLFVFNRTSSKIASLLVGGATACASPSDVARQTDVIITMLADDSALQEVTSGDAGIIRSMPNGGIHIAMGTHDVSVIKRLTAVHEAAGQTLIAAPVLGRPDAVTTGRLGIIVGGDAKSVARCLPIYEALGRRVFQAGPDPSAASAMKLANNFLLASAIESIGEAFALVEKSGVDVQVFHDLVTDGLFASPAYNTYAKIIANKAWDEVGFTVSLALKDINLALAAGGAIGVPLPSANVCRDRLLGASAHGEGELDWAVMARDQARASGLI